MAAVASPRRDRRGLTFGIYLAGVATMPALVLRIGTVTVSDLLIGVAFIAALLSGKLAQIPLSSGYMLAGLALGVGGVVAATQSVTASGSMLVTLRLLYILAVWSLLTTALVRTKPQLDAVLSALMVGAAATGAAAAAQVALGVAIPDSEVAFGRVSGLGTHPNGQGGFLALSFAVAIGCLLHRRIRTYAIVGAAASLVGLILAGSISGMLGAGLGASAALIITGLTSRKIVTVIALAGGTFWLFANSASLFPDGVSPLQRLLDTTGNGEGESTLDIRLRTMQYAWDHIWAQPFNAGVGMTGADGATFDRTLQAHNVLLLMWFQGGILCLIGIVVTLGTAWRYLGRVTGSTRTALAAGFVAVVAFAMTGPVVYDRWFWLPILLAFSASRVKDPLAEPEKTDGGASQVEHTQPLLAGKQGHHPK